MKVQIGQVWQACDGVKGQKELSPGELNWEKSLTVAVVSVRREHESWCGTILNNTFPTCFRQVGDSVYYPDTMVSLHNWRVVGWCCAECQKFYRGAEPNRPNGTMICWVCDCK
jgi:hypothetical protein